MPKYIVTHSLYDYIANDRSHPFNDGDEEDKHNASDIPIGASEEGKLKAYFARFLNFA